MREDVMNRRSLLKSVAAVGSVGLAGAYPAAQNAGRPPVPAIETRDGATLFLREWGTGTPVLFVHSWAVNADLWQYQMVHLSTQGLRCIAYDQRGHGRSSDPGHGYDFDTLADDLATVIDKLGLESVTLVGHSMGCSEIVRYLSRRGAGRVARIVLVSPTLPFMMKTPDNPDGIDKAALERLRAMFTRDFPKWLAANARPFFVPETSPAMVEWGIQMCLQASLKAIVDCNRADLETDFRAELPRITVPTLIIHGDTDVSAPVERTGKPTAHLIRRSQLKVYEGAPHGLMLTHVDRLNADLLAFIRG
jgi:non-heme chloroperoxidase